MPCLKELGERCRNTTRDGGFYGEALLSWRVKYTARPRRTNVISASSNPNQRRGELTAKVDCSVRWVWRVILKIKLGLVGYQRENVKNTAKKSESDKSEYHRFHFEDIERLKNATKSSVFLVRPHVNRGENMTGGEER